MTWKRDTWSNPFPSWTALHQNALTTRKMERYPSRTQCYRDWDKLLTPKTQPWHWPLCTSASQLTSLSFSFPIYTRRAAHWSPRSLAGLISVTMYRCDPKSPNRSWLFCKNQIVLNTNGKLAIFLKKSCLFIFVKSTYGHTDISVSPIVRNI